jgi:hypothetical protein
MSDFKKAFWRKQTMLFSEDSTPSNKHRQSCFDRRNTKLRNKDIIHAFPLTSFSVGTPIFPINITNGPFVQLIPSLYIQNVHLFGTFDPEKHWFQLAQHDYKISHKLPVIFVQTFQTTFLMQH